MLREDMTMLCLRKTGWMLATIVLGMVVAGGQAVRADGPATRPGADLNPDGPNAVDVVPEIILHDKKRDKDLPLFITYPKGDGPFPVIIFSHGAGGSGRNYEPLLKYWSSHGYVCVAPTHAESLSLRANRNLEQAPAQNQKRDDNAPQVDLGLRGTVRGAVRDAQAGENRAADVSFVIDSLDDVAAQAPALKGKMDARHLGVGGHSLGAYTAQLVGGAVVEGANGKQETFADDRAIAILQLSGQGAGQQGLTEHSWDKFDKPMMTMTGSRDRGAQGQGPEWKKEPYDRAPAGDKYHVFIDGANHFSFSGRLAGAEANRLANYGGADQKAVFSYIETSTQAFWDAYLKGDEKAKEYLKSDGLKQMSKGAVTVERK